jgi:hypothetical protein
MESTAEAETPRSFVRWAALSSIAAVVADRVYLDKFYYKLYPNIYVLLVADSGLRKGFATALAKTLVSLTDVTRVISGRNSIEAVVKTLATTVTRPKRPPLTKAHGFITSGELSTTFIENPFTFTILMDLHDGHYHKEGWDNTLKSSGVEELKNVSVNMLGAINPVLFKAMISKKDVTGGFIARTIIVEETQRACKNSLIRAPKKTLDINELLTHLKTLSTLEGQFVWDPATADYFDEWYQSFNPEKMKDETGTANRIHDQILKVAMILSLAESTELILHKRHIDSAMKLLEKAIRTAGNIGKGQGGLTEFGPKIKLVLDELTKDENHKVRRSYLLRKYWSDMTSPELDVIIITLEQSKAISVKKLGEGRDEVYVATPTLLADLAAFQKPFS